MEHQEQRLIFQAHQQELLLFEWTSTANVGFGTSGTGNIPAFVAVNGGA
ncbi:MAG: hypothetical protein R2822_17010 [Spirosomataceae bacterium]